MSGYLLTLLGVIMLGVLVDIILPSGSTSKYISGIFAIFVLFVIISPVLNFIKSGYSLSGTFTPTDIKLNQQLLYNMTNSKFNAVSDDIEQYLKNKGYQGVEVTIEFELQNENVKITQVLADLTNLVINSNSTNINKYVFIRQAVQSHVAVAEEVIAFCE